MLTHASRLAPPRDLDARQASSSRLLLVRHGRGLGPPIRFRAIRPAQCQPMFDDIRRRYPSLGQCLDYWETGQPLPDLAGVRAVVFLLQDPLRERYPDCYRSASQLAEAAAAAGARLVNPPDSLSNTIKSRQSKLWRDAGIPTPASHSYESIQQLREAVAGLEGPVIIKADTLHAQQRTLICRGIEELNRIAASEVPTPGAVSPLVDTREGYRGLDPESPFATHFHKKRAMVFGRHVCNNHVFFADQPIVGCVSSTFGHFRSINPWRRLRQNAKYEAHLQCDFDYWSSPPEHADLLSRAAAVLGVEFAAIDYSVSADGGVTLWEANPFFSLHRWPYAVLGRRRKLKMRMPRIHDAAAMFFRDLIVEGSPGERP